MQKLDTLTSMILLWLRPEPLAEPLQQPWEKLSTEPMLHINAANTQTRGRLLKA